MFTTDGFYNGRILRRNDLQRMDFYNEWMFATDRFLQRMDICNGWMFYNRRRAVDQVRQVRFLDPVGHAEAFRKVDELVGAEGDVLAHQGTAPREGVNFIEFVVQVSRPAFQFAQPVLVAPPLHRLRLQQRLGHKRAGSRRTQFCNGIIYNGWISCNGWIYNGYFHNGWVL
jgi:hypothetical protein